MIRERVARLLERLATEPQYATQGATLFVDLERSEVRRGYTPRAVVETFLVVSFKSFSFRSENGRKPEVD